MRAAHVSRPRPGREINAFNCIGGWRDVRPQIDHVRIRRSRRRPNAKRVQAPFCTAATSRSRR
jgi:hypothetical protein